MLLLNHHQLQDLGLKFYFKYPTFPRHPTLADLMVLGFDCKPMNWDNGRLQQIGKDVIDALPQDTRDLLIQAAEFEGDLGMYSEDSLERVLNATIEGTRLLLQAGAGQPQLGEGRRTGGLEMNDAIRAYLNAKAERAVHASYQLDNVNKPTANNIEMTGGRGDIKDDPRLRGVNSNEELILQAYPQQEGSHNLEEAMEVRRTGLKGSTGLR